MRWAQYENFDTRPEDLIPASIECIGEIDTDELWEVAEECRKWVAAPVTQQVDPSWLEEAPEEKPSTGPRMG